MKKKEMKKKGIKKKVAGGSAVAAIAAVLLLLPKNGLGLGGGGNGIGIPGISQESQEDSQRETIQQEGIEDQQIDQSQAEELSSVVIITIKENQVFVGERQFDTAEELKAYIEEIHTDEREFKLRDEHSILETYEWVVKVFDELKIPLIPVEE